MLEPAYPGAEAWVQAVHRYSRAAYPGVAGFDDRTGNAIIRVARAEVECAGESGITHATPDAIAALAGLPVREVRRIRAGLLAAGLISIIERVGTTGPNVRRLHLSTLDPGSMLLPETATGDR